MDQCDTLENVCQTDTILVLELYDPFVGSQSNSELSLENSSLPPGPEYQEQQYFVHLFLLYLSHPELINPCSRSIPNLDRKEI